MTNNPQGGVGQVFHRGVGSILNTGFMIEQRADAGPVDQNAELAKLFTERVGIPTEDIFVFPLQPSTQGTDSYYTRMSEQSLITYQQDARDGTPFMNSHRTGGCITEAELPLGQSFDGRLVGTPVDETPIFGRDVIPEPDDVDLFNLGMTLQTWDYMQAGIRPNGDMGLSTDDAIKMIGSRTSREISIGFGHKSPDRLLYVCGLCGNPVGQGSEDPDLQCNHVPGFRSKDTGHVAFAWVHNGRMYEHSLVWAGATPGAIVGNAPAPLVMHARSVAGNGLMTATEIDLAEEMYGTKVGPGKQFAAPDTTNLTHTEVIEVAEKEKQALLEVETPEADLIENEEDCDKNEVRTIKQHLIEIGAGQDRNTEALIASAEATNRMLEALVERSEPVVVELDDNDLVEQLEARFAEMEAKLREEMAGLTDDESDITARELLVESVIAASVRAYGAVAVDRARLEKMLSVLDEDELLVEAKRVEALNPFQAGRQTVKAEEKPVSGMKKKDVSLHKM